MPTPTPTTSEFRFFLKLPEELQLHILEYLAPSDLEVLSRVSKCLNRIAQADNLWKAYFKKEYQTAENRQEYLRTTSPIKAFSNHPEASREECLHLHPIVKGLVKLSEETPDEELRTVRLKYLALEDVAYATCILAYPPLLRMILQEKQLESLSLWLGHITVLFPKTNLYPLKNYQVFEEFFGPLEMAVLILHFAESPLETFVYFLQSQPLLRIVFASAECKKILQNIIEERIQVLPQAVQSFLGHEKLIEDYFNSPEDQAWIAQIATAVQQALPPSNAEAHTATIAGP